MAQFDRSLGWVAFANESVAYGTLGTTLVYQQGMSVAGQFVETREPVPVLGSVTPTVGRRINSHWSGTVGLAFTQEDDDIGLLYDHLASQAGSLYTFGGTPTVNSLSLFYDLGGVEYDVAGGIVSSVTWNLNNNTYSTMDVAMIGRAPVEYAGSARTPTLPPVTEVVVPSGLTTFTVNSTAIEGITGAQITYSRTITGMERQRLGSAALARPIAYERPEITASFNLELDDASGNDTVAEIADMLSGTSSGTIVLGNFAMSGCQIVGDLPELARGLGNVNLSVRATGLVVTTT